LSEATADVYIGAKVKIFAAENMGVIRDEIINMGFFVSALQDTIDQVKKIFSIVQIVLGLFGFVALIVSAIGMFNTMTVLLLERTNEIGIMRSIGVTRNDVRKLFMFEAMIMGFLGGLGGVLLGHLGGVLANLGINLLARSFGGQALSLFSRPFSFIIIIIIFSTIIGFITGIFPAQRAAKIKPLDALRYK
jgi:ABC-type antimicrobial peptide transport system permease subunit